MAGPSSAYPPWRRIAEGSALFLAALLLAGCAGEARVQVADAFPALIVAPRPVKLALVLDERFRTAAVQPVKGVRIELGAAQTALFRQAFAALAEELRVVDEGRLPPDSDLVVRPELLEVQLATPADTYLNVYEVWLKYRVALLTSGGEPLGEWQMAAYGRTPDGLLRSREEAIRRAATVALRDAGAKLALDFYRAPPVAAWLARNALEVAGP